MHWLRVAYDWYVIHKGPFEVLALLLAMLGTLFAVQSIQDGRKMTKDLRSVFDHLTTKAIGPFPDYMNELERLITTARDSVVIACDFPAYGAWADRGRWGALCKALENRKAERVRSGRKFEVRMLVLDGPARSRALEDRFPETDWRDYVRRGGFQKSRRMYEELENTRVSEQRDKFLAQMEERQERGLDAELRFAERWETSQLLPVHLFIADGERALFSIPGYGEELMEFGFMTEEAGLVRALNSIWSRYLADARRVGESGNISRLRSG